MLIRNWITRFIGNALERLKAPFYRKSLMTVLTIACLPIALIGIVIYITGVRQIENESSRMHQMQLTQAYDRIEEYMSHLELVSSQWAFHSAFDIRLQTMDLRDQFDETQNLYVSLSALERTDTMIGEVLLYLRNQQVTISPVEGVVPLQDSNRDSYSQLLKEQGKVYWTHTLSQGLQPGKNRASLSLIIKLPGIGNVESFGAIIVHLDNTKVAHLFNDAYRQEEGASFILRKDGMFVARGGQAVGEVAKNELEQALSQYVLAQGTDSGSVVYHYKANAYSLSYRSMNRLGSEWIYVTATPLTKLTAPVKTLSRLIIGVSLMVMLIAIILSWLASGRIYGPVQRLVRLFQGGREEERNGDEFALIEDHWKNISRESQMLQTRLEDQLPAMREGFFLQLVQGHLIHLSESDIRERLEQLGWSAGNRMYVLVVLQLTGFTHISGRFSEGDEPLIGFAAANIVNEMAFPLKGLKHVVHFQDLSIGLLLSLPEEDWSKKWKSDLINKLQEWMRALHSILHLHVTASIGVPTTSVHQIPQAMEDVKRGLRYRSLQQENQVLDMAELLPQGRDPVSYPFAAEKEVIQAVRLGLEEDTIEALGRFMDEYRLKTDTELHVQQGMLQLLGSIQSAILQSGYSTNELFAGANLFIELSEIREPEHMLSWFEHKVIKPYTKLLMETQDIQIKRLVERAMETIGERYMTDLSLESCADLHSTYPQKLSSAFKKVTGMNFIDYLTQFRMEQSKELLMSTHLKINEVAERVGYQPSYFIRVFKKHEGLTPKEYRDTHGVEYK